MIQRKDQREMTEEDEGALLPYAGFVMLLNMLSPDGGNALEMCEEDMFCDFECVERRDGSPMTEEDEEALLPYSGMISVFAILSNLSGEVDTPPTGHCENESESDFENELTNPFTGIVRHDGQMFTEDDASALMEFGGMIYAMKMMAIVITMVNESCDPFVEVSRLDGKELDEADDAILMEFYPAFKFVSSAYGCLFPPLAAVFYPDGDEDLAEIGEQLAEKYVESSSEDTELSYSAWSMVGNVFVAVYKKTFGSLSKSPWDTKKSSNDTGLKRKPSGAELSAWIGLATQKTFGLDDPTRKVRARAVL